MINKWILDNFKSIDKEKELDFRPLTIFTGANSSGKSTILQSILMVTQTLQNSIMSRSIVLNGWFKKFGSYSDIVNHRDINKNIKVGFSIEDNNNNSNARFIRLGDPIKRVDCDFVITSGGKKDNLQPILESLYIGFEDLAGKKNYLELEACEKKSDPIVKSIIESGYPISDHDFGFNVKTDFKARYALYGNRLHLNYIGASLYHFLPNYLVGYYDRFERFKQYMEELVMSTTVVYQQLNPMEEHDLCKVIEEKTKKIAASILDNRQYSYKNFEPQCKKFLKNFSLEGFHNIIRKSSINDEEKKKIFASLIEDVKKMDLAYSVERVPMYYYPCVETIKSFFCERIKYLGPLREEPKSLYPLESDGSAFDVGLKGENTAAVYENYKNKVIKYIDSSAFDSNKNISFNVKKGTLSDAINNWLVYLGVASQMRTDDKGKIGHELKITTDLFDMEQDLTHVGVGVSQVLPILVLSFLANDGDVIILEQPELHLHPRVQTRLADFFVTMHMLGKQCILETHSEYLINRLRYLVAINDETKISDNTMIYFVEKEDGHSKYRPVTINKYGVIEDWPDGFFDESEKIAAQILCAGMEKKLKEDGEDEDDE